MTTEITPVSEISITLSKMQDNFRKALPAHIKPERFIAVAQTALLNAPNLASLDRNSLYQAFTQAAQDGLMPDGREAAIIPFKGKAKYTAMVAGICKKARNSGEIATIDAQVVYSKDVYEAWTDEKGPHFKHVKSRGDRGQIEMTYAYALGKDGAVYFEEISEEQMNKIKAMSKSTDSPWHGPFADEMRRKSALRRLGKYRLPNSSDLVSVFEKDDEIYEEHETEDVVITEAPEKSSRLSNIVASKSVEVETVVVVAEPVMSVEEAALMAEEVFKPAPAPVASVTSVTGLIETIKANDGIGTNGAWRRFAAKIGGNYYGTFDTKINEQLTAALDAGKEVTVEYVELTKGGKVMRNIKSVMPAIVCDNEMPI